MTNDEDDASSDGRRFETPSTRSAPASSMGDATAGAGGDRSASSPWEASSARPAPVGAGNAPPSIDGAALQALTAAAQQALVDAKNDRRRARRSAFWWRLAAILLLVGAGVAAFSQPEAMSSPHIARYSVLGVIVDDRARDALLDEIANDDAAQALIVRIDSPGGTTVGGEALYDSLRRVAEKKPVVAVMGEVAASAGYITALAADHIVARGNTITASIGVILTAPNFAGALDAIGVEVVEVKSGAQKSEPSPYRPVDPDKLEAEQVLIDDSFAWFLGLVRERREIASSDLEAMSDGRILTGRMAAAMNLVDTLGGEREAIAWLEKTHDVAGGLPVVERVLTLEDEGLFGSIADQIFGAAGLSIASFPLTDGPVLVSKAR